MCFVHWHVLLSPLCYWALNLLSCGTEYTNILWAVASSVLLALYKTITERPHHLLELRVKEIRGRQRGERKVWILWGQSSSLPVCFGETFTGWRKENSFFKAFWSTGFSKFSVSKNGKRRKVWEEEEEEERLQLLKVGSWEECQWLRMQVVSFDWANKSDLSKV